MTNENEEYKVKLPQLQVLRALIVRHDGDTEAAVADFAENYVHEEKKDADFWTPFAESIKSDTAFIDKWQQAQRAQGSEVNAGKTNVDTPQPEVSD